MNSTPINLAVLASGGGTTLQNLLDQIRAGHLSARIKLVLASRPNIRALSRAAEANLPHFVVDRKSIPDIKTFSDKVVSLIDAAKIDLVCLAGWLSILDIPDRYENRVINIHPALLPSFGGQGMYGEKIHQAVLDHGCKVSGCTVHFVDAHYDNGPIILQRTCPVLDNDTPASLAARVFEQEKIAYPEAIRLIQQGRLRIEGRRVFLKDPS